MKCPVCKKEEVLDDELNCHPDEHHCESFHFWHLCPVHKEIALDRAYRKMELHVMYKDLKVDETKCTCYMRDGELKHLRTMVKDETDLNVFWGIVLRLEKADNTHRELANLNGALKTKNKQLDALHFVWCDGGCGSGVHRFGEMKDVELTEEIVRQAEANTKRLRTWFLNRERSKEYEKEKKDKKTPILERIKQVLSKRSNS